MTSFSNKARTVVPGDGSFVSLSGSNELGMSERIMESYVFKLQYSPDACGSLQKIELDLPELDFPEGKTVTEV